MRDSSTTLSQLHRQAEAIERKYAREMTGNGALRKN